MDPLSVTASVISVIQAAGKVISICCDYRSSVKGSSWEVSRILEDTRSLRSILQNLEELADKAETVGAVEQPRLPALKSLCDPDTGILSSCYSELEKLTCKLAPPGWSGPAGSKRRGLIEALSWPLKKKDTEKVLDSIRRYKDTISVAVYADQIPSILAIEDATQETKVSLSGLKNDTYGLNVRNWLHAVDPHPKYAKTIDDRVQGTGTWLIDNRKFDRWKRGRDSSLWLYGIPGCGKTVLCSTAIENVLEQRSMSTDKAIGVAYFFFEFSNWDQQDRDTMLRSLSSQLWLQNREGANAVDALYTACGSGASQPSSVMLKNALKQLVQSFGDTFIILDALDECKERQRLMPSLEEMAGWKISSLHMLFTSRKEKDIEESLSTILTEEQRICIQSAVVEDDIRNYVRTRIRTDRDLRKWQKPEVQTEIETVLMEKAGGMFQWVKCQLDALGRCLSLSSLRKAFRSLPKDLDDTYARILQSIETDEQSKLVTKILQWLAYSRRSLSLAEISEALTVDPEDDHQFDVERRLEDPQDLLRICSSLVTTVRWPGEFRDLPESRNILKFAHFSVREYLESSRIHDGPAKRYAIQEIRSNTFLAESCIIYLHHLGISLKRTEKDYFDFLEEEHPFAIYAIYGWAHHAERAKEGGNIVALSRAFSREAYRFPRWWWWEESDDRPGFTPFDDRGTYLPLIQASELNLPKITSALILEGADVNTPDKRGCTPLIAMSHHFGRSEMIQLLLKHGADVNFENRTGFTALMMAACQGNLQAVRVLLDSGAEIDIQRRNEHTALVDAVEWRQPKVVQFLLDRGASTRHPIGRRALMIACAYSYTEIVEILLERSIGVDAEQYDKRTPESIHAPGCLAIALFVTLQRAKVHLAELLLKYGADVNAGLTIDGGTHCVLLQHAFNLDEVFMADFLLQHGANPSLVVSEHLEEDGMRLYKERVLKHESQNSVSRVQEEETEEAVVEV